MAATTTPAPATETDETTDPPKRQITEEEGAALLKAYGNAQGNLTAAEESMEEAKEECEKAAKAIWEALGNDEFMWNGTKYRAVRRQDKGSKPPTFSYYLKTVSKDESQIRKFGN